jgi:hypothetical protein
MSLPDASKGAYLVLCTATIVLNGFMSLTYYTSKALQVHPAGILQCISVLEIICAFHTLPWVFNTSNLPAIDFIRKALISLIGLSRDNSTALLCGINQFFLTFSIVGIICYNTALCVDLVVSLWRPISSISKRLVLYHTFAILAVIYFTLYLDLQDNYIEDCHPTRENSVTLVNSGAVMILLMAYISIAPLSIMYASYRIYRSSALFSSKKRTWLIRYIAYVCCFVFTWVWAVISYFYSDGDANESLNFICLVMINSSGCILAIVRASEPIFCKELCIYLKHNRLRDLQDENMPLSAQIQQEQRQELFHIILTSLCYAWSNIELEDSLSRDYYVKRVHQVEDSMAHSMEVWGHAVSDSPEVKLEEFSPAVFSQIKKATNVFNSDLFSAFSPLRNIDGIKKATEGDGKSGSFMMMSSNERFLLKTVSSKELKYFTKKMLPKYHEHLEHNPNSNLVKVYGAFTLDYPGIEAVSVIIMENIMPKSLLKLYDLKGSTVNRRAKSSSKVGKDLNFLDRIETDPIQMRHADVEDLLRQLSRDTQLLRSLRVMDYSLLFGISKEKEGVHVFSSEDNEMHFHIGIIDFMIPYDSVKNLETIFRTLSMPHKHRLISAVDSEQYARRFINFMLAVFSPSDKNFSFVSLN